MTEFIFRIRPDVARLAGSFGRAQRMLELFDEQLNPVGHWDSESYDIIHFSCQCYWSSGVSYQWEECTLSQWSDYRKSELYRYDEHCVDEQTIVDATIDAPAIRHVAMLLRMLSGEGHADPGEPFDGGVK